jgi:hypothetical protein
MSLTPYFAVTQTARAPVSAPSSVTQDWLALGLAWRGWVFENIAVECNVLPQVLRDVFFWEDRRHRTLWLACPTVDALVRMDVELIGPLVDAVDWAHVDACTILGIDTGFGDDVRHMLEK